jgi:orotidine-5'-phosphate decarboxylase
MRKNPIILPYDGYLDSRELIDDLYRDLSNYAIAKLVSFVKINDATFSDAMPAPTLVAKIWKIIESLNLENQVGIFLDLKSSDTSGTVENIANHFSSSRQGILTVRSNLSGMGYLEIRRMLPQIKIALVSFLTDNSVRDCLEQYGLFPEEKILHDMRIVQRKYDRVRQPEDPEFAFDMIVSSPLEVPYLYLNEKHIFRRRFKKITPGICDYWMPKGQQERVTGIAKALEDGSDYVVTGSQMRKGNPDKEISAEESQKRTADEIERVLRSKS